LTIQITRFLKAAPEKRLVAGFYRLFYERKSQLIFGHEAFVEMPISYCIRYGLGRVAVVAGVNPFAVVFSAFPCVLQYPGRAGRSRVA
jgi:hypothetical protein